MVQSTRQSSSWPVGPGEMAECIRRFDWSATALGPIAGWPPHLRTAVDICLASPLPTSILWGEKRLQIYNDAYRSIAQDRHPAILGRPALENWPEARELIGPILDRVFLNGEPTRAENLPVRLYDGNGVPVERLFTFSFSAVRDRYGVVTGALHSVVETTARFRSERQLDELITNAGLTADFHALFRAAPAPLLLLAPPDFRILAANDAFVRVGGAQADLVGRTVFDLAAGSPDRTEVEAELHASLERVLAQRLPDTLPLIAREGPDQPGGRRWWSIINTPVLDPKGEVALIVHRAEDVSELVRLRSASEARVQVGRDQQALVARLYASCSNGHEPTREDMPHAVSDRPLGNMLDAISDYIYAFDREHRLAYANRALLELFGLRREQLLGKTFDDLGYPPELARRLGQHLTHIFATGESVEDEVFFTSPTGSRAYYQFVWGPVRDDQGQIERVVGVSRDTSERRRMEERLRQGEARQSFLLHMGDRLRGLMDAGQITATASAMVGHQLRVGRCGYGQVTECGRFFVVEGDWTDGVMPSLKGRVQLADFGEPVVAQYRAGQTVVLEDSLDDLRTRGAGQAYGEAGGVRAGIGIPLIKNGRFVAAFYVHQSAPRHWRDEEVALVGEVAERIWSAVVRAQAEHELRESERRYRALFDAIDEGFCLLEKIDAPGAPSDYAYLATNPGFAVQTGVGGVVGKTLREVFPDATSFWYETFDQIIDGGEARRFEHGLVTRGRVFDVYACRLDDGTRRRVAVIFNDITARKRHEQHQRLLLNELNHRVKNTLVTVQSMATQSFPPGADPEQARQQFEGRLMALSRAHDVLTRESWGGAPLAGIVQQAIAPYRGRRDDRLRADGPPVWLPPRHALAFAMALHELGTNAVKYGALSNQEGIVTIEWDLLDGRLRLRWSESGGPTVAPPTRRGFGSRLIERGLRHEIGGKVTLEFPPTGLVCTIETPLAATERPTSAA